jgi:flagella basal body P-ring formation protein FlgA
MSAKNYTMCFAIATVVALFAAINSAAAIQVKLRERIVPKASVVRLGDVAEITAADRQQARQLAAVPLMPAPAPGTEQFLRKREVADMLAANGIELGDIHWSGAEQVAVAAATGVQTAAIQETTEGDAGAPVNRRAEILAGANAAPATPQLDAAQAGELKIMLGRILGDFVKAKSGKTETGRIEFKVTERQLAQLAEAMSLPVCGGGSEPWTGRQKFTLSFATVNGTVQMPVYADVAEVPMPVVVAIRPVARGNVITGADVEVRMIDSIARTAGQRATFDSVENIIGMEARKPLQADEVVLADQVQSPVLVKRGELITVGSQSGGIRVRTSARAAQDGAKGDLIAVESLESKQKYDARVVGLREVAVFAPARVATPEPHKRVDTARR